MDMNSVQAEIGFIGGTGTFSINFPADMEEPGTEVLARDLVFSTPFGPSAPLTLFSTGNPSRWVLAAKMHGRIPGVSWGESSQRLFSALMQAGVKKIIAEGGVGSVNHLLDLRDIVVVDDYIDYSLRRNVGLQEGYLSVMRRPICPILHQTLVEAARESSLGRVFKRGVYLVTDGSHFESVAEVNMFRQWGADIVGQTLCPEVYLAREMGACYAGIYLVVNYGEGVVKPWEHRDLKDIFFQDARAFGAIILKALGRIDFQEDCGCSELRKPTLLRSENTGGNRNQD